jgi:cysteine desulfurase
LDYAATAPLREGAAVAMAALEESKRNPSSLHAEGRAARVMLDDARERIAAAIGARRGEIVLTSGGTEADNLALIGVLHAVPRPAHVVVSAIEHSAVLRALEHLSDDGVETTVLSVDNSGSVDPANFARVLRPHTRLASIMYANNEVGTIQPIPLLAAIAREHGVLFHTDAVAAAMWLDLDVTRLGVDLLSLSAHKVYGPHGVGALYVRRGVPLSPMLLGGGQEGGRRSGTENVAGAVGFARALELAVAERPEVTARVGGLRERLEDGIHERIPGSRLNGAAAQRLPNICNCSVQGVEAGDLLIALDLAGLAVSAGSACATGALEPSHVLAAMGASSGGGLRLSLGIGTTADDIEGALEILAGACAGGLGRFKTNRARLETQA